MLVTHQIDFIVLLESSFQNGRGEVQGTLPMFFFYSNDEKALDDLRVLMDINGQVMTKDRYPLAIRQFIEGSPDFADMFNAGFFFFRSLIHTDSTTYGNDIDAANVINYLSGTDELEIDPKLDYFSKAKQSGQYQFNFKKSFKPVSRRV